MTEERKGFEGWAILELMGHRRLGGYVTEQEIAGSAFLRIDVPDEPGPTGQEYQATQFYSSAAVYCITPSTETMARAAARFATVEPVQEWEARWLRPALEPAPATDDDLDF